MKHLRKQYSPEEVKEIVRHLFVMMHNIDPRFIHSFVEEMHEPPIQVLGQLAVKDYMGVGSDVIINGRNVKEYGYEYDPNLVFNRWIKSLLYRLGLTPPVYTGKDMKLKIASKTIAVAKNVSYHVGAGNVPIKSHGRFNVYSSDDEET